MAVEVEAVCAQPESQSGGVKSRPRQCGTRPPSVPTPLGTLSHIHTEHDTQNGQKGCNNQSPFKSTVHKGYNFPCSTIITQIARRRSSIAM